MSSPHYVYRRLIEFEERAAAIYLKVAARFSPGNPELAGVWIEMATHENEHGALLQFCLAERLFASFPVNSTDISRLSTLFQNTERRAADPNLTVDEAFSIAGELEASKVNEIYLHLTSPMHQSMYLLRKKITVDMPDHIDTLVAAARKFRVNTKTLGKLERLTFKQSA